MEQVNTIARPYAKAILDFCNEYNASKDAWETLLNVFKVALEDEVGQQILNTSIGRPWEVKKYLLHVLPPELFSENVSNFLQVVEDNQRFAYLPAIYEGFVELRQGEDAPLPFTVITARPLDEQTLASIGQALIGRFKKNVKLETKVDSSILSGFIIVGEDQKIDCSGRKTLDNLKTVLLKQ